MVGKINLFLLLSFIILLTPIGISQYGYDNHSGSYAYDDSNAITSSSTGGGSSNVTSFLNLTDTPASYAGDGGDCVKVNVGETGLEFVSCGGGGDFSFSDFQSSFDLNWTALGFAPLIYNHTITANETIFNTYNSVWVSTFNQTYADLIPLVYNYSDVISFSGIENNTLGWNVSFTNIDENLIYNYTAINPYLYNQTTPAEAYALDLNTTIYNTFKDFNYNMTDIYTNGTGLILNNNQFNISSYVGQWLYNQTGDYNYNQTYPFVNSTWDYNQSISSNFDYNQTTIANAYTDTINSTIYDTFVGFNYNQSAVSDITMWLYNQSENVPGKEFLYNQTEAFVIEPNSTLLTIANITDLNGDLIINWTSSSGITKWLYNQTSNSIYYYNQSENIPNSEFIYNHTITANETIVNAYGKFFYNMTISADGDFDYNFTLVQPNNVHTLDIDNITNFNFNYNQTSNSIYYYNQSTPYDAFNYNQTLPVFTGSLLNATIDDRAGVDTSEFLKNNTQVYFSSVGVGTATPNNPLNVIGDANVTGDLILTGNSLPYIWLDGPTSLGWTTAHSFIRHDTSGYIDIKPNSATYGLIIRDDGSSAYGNIDVASGYLSIGYKQADGPLFLDDNDNVGIGVSSVDTNFNLQVYGAPLGVTSSASVAPNIALSAGDVYIEGDLEIDGLSAIASEVGYPLCIEPSTGKVYYDDVGVSCSQAASPFYYSMLPSGEEYYEAEFLANLNSSEEESVQTFTMTNPTRYGVVYEKKTETSYIDLLTRKIIYTDDIAFGLGKTTKTLIQKPVGIKELEADEGDYYEMTIGQKLLIDWGELPINETQIVTTSLVTKGYYETDKGYYTNFFNTDGEEVTKDAEGNFYYRFVYSLKVDSSIKGEHEFLLDTRSCVDNEKTKSVDCKSYFLTEVIPNSKEQELKTAYTHYLEGIKQKIDLDGIEFKTGDLPIKNDTGVDEVLE